MKSVVTGIARAPSHIADIERCVAGSESASSLGDFALARAAVAAKRLIIACIPFRHPAAVPVLQNVYSPV